MANQSPTIIVKNLTKKFANFTAVNNINFEVHQGEIFGFLGPNGSGKTTSIRMMLGLLQPTSGSVKVLGIDIKNNASKIRPRVGYMSQRFSLYNDLTVMQNLRFYGAAYGLSNENLKSRIDEALEIANLKGHEEEKTKDLSGGWRQRLALSATILHRPDILFLDEPTAGVDPLSRRAFWNLLYQLIADGVTVFVTTHYMDEAEHCHRLAFIQRGEIIAYGTPSEIKNEKTRGDVLEIEPTDTTRAYKILKAAQTDQTIPLEEVELYGTFIHLVAPDIKRHQNAVKNLLKNADIQIKYKSLIEPSLEDIFISAMKK